MGMRVYYPNDLTDCGMQLYLQGDRDSAKQLGERMMELYEGCTHVVSLSSAAVAYMQRCFGSLFHNTTLHNDYRRFIGRCYDLSDFLVNVALYVPQGVVFPHSVAVMDHCSTSVDYHCSAHPDRRGLHEEPRWLLRAVDGLRLVEMEQQDVCCGYGGQFALQFTPISDYLARRKADNALSAGAEIIASTEMGCLFHLQSYIDKQGLRLRCMHVADILCQD